MRFFGCSPVFHSGEQWSFLYRGGKRFVSVDSVYSGKRGEEREGGGGGDGGSGGKR